MLSADRPLFVENRFNRDRLVVADNGRSFSLQTMRDFCWNRLCSVVYRSAWWRNGGPQALAVGMKTCCGPESLSLIVDYGEMIKNALRVVEKCPHAGWHVARRGKNELNRTRRQLELT